MPTAPPTAAEGVAASGLLAGDLLALLPQDENGVFSPASISSVFAMLYAGARGETASQIKTAMHFTSSPEKILAGPGALATAALPPAKPVKGLLGARVVANNGNSVRITEVTKKSVAAEAGLVPGDLLFKVDGQTVAEETDYAAAMDRAGDSVQLQWFSSSRKAIEEKRLSLLGKTPTAPFQSANAVWVDSDNPIDPQYKTSLEGAGGWIQAIDYKKDTAAALKTINAWVAARTHDRISNILESGALDKNTRLVLTNAVYLNAEWANPLESAAPMRWRGIAQPRENVPAMTRTSTFDYAETARCQVVELGYKDSSLAMAILLPRANVTWAEFRKECSAGRLAELLTDLKPKRVKLTLPKFHIAKGLALEAWLREKMPHAFADDADFSGIRSQKDLKITAVRHQAFINVDEKGTEAGAATAATVGLRAFRLPDASFLADHPFLFVLRDRTSKVILFLGQLLEPEVPSA
jgi:serpin B